MSLNPLAVVPLERCHCTDGVPTLRWRLTDADAAPAPAKFTARTS
jgi:hypothetical protein